MRIIDPPHIDELYKKVLPYLKYDERNGYVLKDNTPPEIIEMYREIMKWNTDNMIA